MAGMVRRVLFFIFVLLVAACSQYNLAITGNIEDGTELSSEGRLEEIISDLAPSAKYALLIGSD